MKTRPHIFAIHFSVIAFELFCPQLACLSEKLVALDILSAGRDACATSHVTEGTSCTTMPHEMERRFKKNRNRARAQPCRRTISLIQIGANGEVQPLETG